MSNATNAVICNHIVQTVDEQVMQILNIGLPMAPLFGWQVCLILHLVNHVVIASNNIHVTIHWRPLVPRHKNYAIVASVPRVKSIGGVERPPTLKAEFLFLINSVANVLVFIEQVTVTVEDKSVSGCEYSVFSNKLSLAKILSCTGKESNAGVGSLVRIWISF